MGNYLWVVERLKKGKWVPTFVVDVTKKGGFEELKSMRFSNPESKFRLSKYVYKDW